MIYRAFYPGPDGVYQIDVIEHEGELWLVPEWLDHSTEGWSTPARIVRLSSLPHHMTVGSPFGDVGIPFGVPKAAVFGPYPPEMRPGIDLVEAPGIRVPRPTQH